MTDHKTFLQIYLKNGYARKEVSMPILIIDEEDDVDLQGHIRTNQLSPHRNSPAGNKSHLSNKYVIRPFPVPPQPPASSDKSETLSHN